MYKAETGRLTIYRGTFVFVVYITWIIYRNGDFYNLNWQRQLKRIVKVKFLNLHITTVIVN